MLAELHKQWQVDTPERRGKTWREGEDLAIQRGKCYAKRDGRILGGEIERKRERERERERRREGEKERCNLEKCILFLPCASYPINIQGNRQLYIFFLDE